MHELPTIRGSLRWALRRWQAHLRRDGASIALLVLLLFGAGEPLLCILHCYLWMPLASPISVGAHHHHLDAAIAPAAFPSRLTPDVGGALGAEDQTSAACYLHQQSGQNDPFSVSPQPFHEMIPPLLLVLLLLLLMISRLATPPGDAPHAVLAPPFRPPISFAG